MWLSLIFFLDVFDEFLSFWSATFVEAWIDSIFVWIHQLPHRHTEQECLTVAFRNTEAAQQFRGYLARLVVGVQHVSGTNGVDAVVVGQCLLPEGLVLPALVVPTVSSPCLIPHPVAVQLLQAFAVRQLVCRVWPVPVGSLRIEVKSLRVVHAVHGLNGLLDEGGRRPAPRFQISQDMHVVDVHRGGGSQLLMRLSPRSAGGISGQRLTCIFRHRVDVRVKGQALLQYQWAVGIVRAQHHGGNIRSTAGLQSILDTRDDGFLHPFHVVVDGGHGFTQTHQQSHVGIFLDKGCYRFARIVADQGRDWTVTVLCLQSVVVGKGLA